MYTQYGSCPDCGGPVFADLTSVPKITYRTTYRTCPPRCHLYNEKAAELVLTEEGEQK